MASTSTLVTLKQLRDNIASTVRETQIDDLIDNFINLTGLEIHNYHSWTWKRQKQTFPTVINQEDYNLDAEVDELAFMRQIMTRWKLIYLPDDLFYRFIPAPEVMSTGTPRYYRRWEETGFATNLAVADTVYVVSSDAADGAGFSVDIRGRNSVGDVVEEVLTLNGTTPVTSATTWAAAGLMQIAKSGLTTGTITCYGTTGAVPLTRLEPNNLSPRFKRVSLYPVPAYVLTIYYEYWMRYRYLVNDADVPQMDAKWSWVLREGALAKTWGYKQNDAAEIRHQALFDRGLAMMRAQDDRNQDYVPIIQPRVTRKSIVRRDADSINDNFPAYSLAP